MSLQVGDKVSFINEALDGVVSKIINQKTVEVTTADGFGIPVLIEELVKVGGNDQTQTLKNAGVKSEARGVHIPQRSNLEKKPYLCFSKNDKGLNDLFVLNNTGFTEFFTIRIKKGGEWILIFSEKVSKQSYVFVSSYEDKELDNFTKVLVDSVNIEFSLKEKQLPKSAEIKIKASKFYKESSFTEIPILEKNAMLIDASGETIEEVQTHEELKKSVESMATIKPLKGPKVIGKIELKSEKGAEIGGRLIYMWKN